MSIIEVNNLGKEYYIGERQKYLALRDILTNIARAPFSWFKDKVVGNKGEGFWALKDVNFKVEQGEVLGIIGRNGAGKSTLLKILSRITPPTTGEIRINGRVGSLLEVGTGFHPELTGRENVYLNGAILGMRKKEIERKFDEIVDFAGIAKFLDTPVKHYSSGMYVRLAFSVAAHLEPEILIVDEVLAVGDAEFQKKCLGKMEDVTKKEGRTVLFVSHNMGAVRSLCSKTAYLEGGRLKTIGNTDAVINQYFEDSSIINASSIGARQDREGSQITKIIDISVTNQDGNAVISSFDKLRVKIKLSSLANIKTVQLKIPFVDISSGVLFRLDTDEIKTSEITDNTVILETDELNFSPAYLSVNVGVLADGVLADYVKNAISFNLIGKSKEGINFYNRDVSMLMVKFKVLN